MVAFGTIALYALNSLFLLTANTPVTATPLPQTGTTPPTSGYWLAKIARNGKAVQQDDASYEIFRNVQEFGAVGDGKTDDTAAINAAISSAGNGVERCGWKCDSRTSQPALVYFPPGTYLVNKPIQMYYYTQMVGDATNLPVIKAAADWEGMGVIDADPYVEGVNWYTNQVSCCLMQSLTGGTSADKRRTTSSARFETLSLTLLPYPMRSAVPAFIGRSRKPLLSRTFVSK